MIAALSHAYMQDVDPATRRWTPRPGEPTRPPMLVAYVRSVRASVRSKLQTTDEPGVLHAPIGLCDLYVIDNEQVARDSEYTHLRMMHAPRVDTAEEFLQTMEEMTRQVIHHANVPWPMLERFMMSSFTELVRDEDQRESVYSKSLSQSYYEGVDDEKKRHANTQRQFAFDLATARRLQLDADSRERFETCKEVDQLNAWALWLAQQPRGTIVTLP